MEKQSESGDFVRDFELGLISSSLLKSPMKVIIPKSIFTDDMILNNDNGNNDDSDSLGKR